MYEIAKYLLEFVIVFLIVYVSYYLLNLKKLKKYNREKAPVGIKYLVNKYNIDIVKIGYKRVFKKLLFCDSLIISLLFIITIFIDNIYLRLLVAFILSIPLFVGVYHLVAMYYKKESEI